MDLRGQLAAASPGQQLRSISANTSTHRHALVRETWTSSLKPEYNFDGIHLLANEQLQQTHHDEFNNFGNLTNRETESNKENCPPTRNAVDGATNSTTSATDHEDEFLHLLKLNDMLFVSGDTGVGKSCSFPMRLLTNAKKEGRRIAMLSFQADSAYAFLMAHFCCESRDEDIGDAIGYISHHFSASGNNLSFIPYQEGGATNYFRNNLEHFTHIILDDVYLQADGFEQLLLLCKETIAAERSKGKAGPKLVFMSTTFGQLKERLVAYLPELSHDSIHVGNSSFKVDVLRLSDVAVLSSSKIARLNTPASRSMMCTRNRFLNSSIDGDPMTPASTNYLCFNSHTMADVAIIREQFETQLVTEALDIPYFHNLDANLDEPDTIELILDVVWFCCRSEYCKGSVLVFLPGASDCMNLTEKFNSSRKAANDPRAYPLHSRMQHVDIVETFDPLANTGVRVPFIPFHEFGIIISIESVLLHCEFPFRIFATAVAETSITMPDVTFVIDCAKNQIVDYSRMEKTYQLEWVSMASREQRKGRVGRVKPGVYVDLVRDDAKQFFPAFPKPALSHQPLSDLVLTLAPKTRTTFSPLQRSRLLFNVPPTNGIQEAVEELVFLGALLRSRDQDSYTITSLGRLALRSGYSAKEHEHTIMAHFFEYVQEDSESSSDGDESDEWDESESEEEEEEDEEEREDAPR